MVNAASLTQPGLIARILHDGGKLLIVGGAITEFMPTSLQNHPQVVVWDDEKQGFSNKEVPANARVIMYNRWVSHGTAAKLREAAVSRHALLFPMLKTGEMKRLLAEVIQTEPAECAAVETAIAEQKTKLQEEKEETTVVQKKISKQGELQRFLSRNLDLDIDFSVKGSKSDEARRLLPLAQKDGLPTTEASIANAIGIIVKNLGKEPTKTRPSVEKKTAATTGASDDFEQLDRLIQDAIAAMKLVQEHLPKVRRETGKLRAMREKALKIFG